MSVKQKDCMGRPSKIHSINLDEVTFYTEKGYTDKQLAKIFCVKEQTINNWKKDYPEFFESLKAGKMLADAKVEASLYQRACGYSHPEIHITNFQGSITETPIIKHYPPDPTSMIFWLKNRKKKEWRDRHEIKQDGEVVHKVEIKALEGISPERLINVALGRETITNDFQQSRN